MNEAHVVVFPRGQLSADDKAAFKEAGVVAVEAENPKDVVQVHLTTPLTLDTTLITGDIIVSSLLHALAAQAPSHGSYDAITTAGKASHEFVRALAHSLLPK